MWRLDKKRTFGPESDVPEGTSAEAVTPALAAATRSSTETRESWAEEIRALGGTTALLHFADGARTRIELSTSHPGGLPQFITGKATLLSNLIRDDLALRNARLAAAEIADKDVELRSVRGIEAVHLAIGLATWSFGGQTFTAPVLLRPVAIRRYGRDVELKLRNRTSINPAFVRVMHDQFGITLDVPGFLALALSSGTFKPQPVIDGLRSMTAHIPGFQVLPRLVVSTFYAPGPSLDAAAASSHPVVSALAGDADAGQRVVEAFSPVQTIAQDDRSPDTDVLLLDADPEQEDVIAQIAAGNAIVVDTLPGTGSTQTIVNAIGALAAAHKRVLVVGPRTATLESISRRLTTVGLPGLAVRAGSLRRDLVQAIGRNEKAEPPQTGDVDEALVRLRRVLLDYRSTLTEVDPGLGISALDALHALAALSATDAPPTTQVRLQQRTLEALATGRDDAGARLAQSASLGQFRYGPGDSPWYGAEFGSTAEARATHELAKRLCNVDIPRLIQQARTLVGQTSMRPFETIAELGIYLRLLMDLRETLDRFLPAVYDRPLTELIAAFGARRESAHVTPVNRRRLKKLAHEYLRPGAHVSDMHDALVRIQQQRVLWQRYAVAGVQPELPTGISDVLVSYQRVFDDLGRLDAPLDRRAPDEQLAGLPLPTLQKVITGLAAESAVMDNLQERTQLLESLRAMGLDPLLDDLSSRHIPAEQAAGELELAWWQSSLEHLLRTKKALLGANTTVLDRLESDFRLVDEAHAGANGQLLASRLAAAWKVGLIDHPDEADRLRALLRADRVSGDALEAEAPHLWPLVAPVWLVSPYDLDRIGGAASFDTVILVDAGATTIAETIPAIARARQVVAFGDRVTQTPSRFRSAIVPPVGDGVEDLDESGIASLHEESTLQRLADVLPEYTLTRSYRAGGEDLADLVNRHFFDGALTSLPWAGSYLGRRSVAVEYVRGGTGMPDERTGAVESVDAEVSRVVDLVIAHAAERPRESLMVTTASARHASRVQQAVLSAFARRADLTDFLLADRAEPFTVATLEQAMALSRDRVIFSVGYGRTPHGRLLSNFGPLSAPGGERMLAVAMTRARRGMHLVSCFTPADLDSARIAPGVQALVDLLADMEEAAQPVEENSDVEPMLVDLAGRLKHRGMNVALSYRGQLALVSSQDGKAVAVETDAVLGEMSLRESLRLRPEVLRRLGWHYLRVHSFDLFSDPDGVAARIAALLGGAPVAAEPPVESAAFDAAHHLAEAR